MYGSLGRRRVGRATAALPGVRYPMTTPAVRARIIGDGVPAKSREGREALLGPLYRAVPTIAAALSRARALLSVSSYSIAGFESTTIPAPACT